MRKGIRKISVILGMVLVTICMTGCSGTSTGEKEAQKEVQRKEEQKKEEKQPEANVKAVGSYKKLYKRLHTISLKQKAREKEWGIEECEDSVLCSNKEKTAESAKEYGTTNVMTKGVEEADRIKNDGKYLYLYEEDYEKNQYGIRIVKADGSKMEEVSFLSIERNSELEEFGSVEEFYVIGDKLILFESLEETKAKLYDIQDRANPKLLQTRKQDGSYISSRVENGYLYLVTEKYNDYCGNRKNSACVPEVEECKVDADCIYVPQLGETKNFVTCSSIAIEDSFEIKDTVSVLASSDSFYMSEKSIYIYNSGIEENTRKTEFLRMSYENGDLKMQAKGTVKGYLTDSFAINEYKGYLRLVMMQENNINDKEEIYDEKKQTESSSLYVLDEDLKIVGQIHDIAPGEQIYSARFLGDTGYFVTFQAIDPLFSVDFTDPTAPKIIGELKIPGFSEYLHPYSEDLLLGIGRNVKDNASDGLKLSMFDVSDPSDVKEQDKKILKECDYSECLYEYKALCIDPEKNLFGFSCERYKEDKWYMEYWLYSYDEKSGFTGNRIVSLDRNEQWVNSIRGTYIGDTFYTVISGKGIVATDLNTKKEIGNYKFL